MKRIRRDEKIIYRLLALPAPTPHTTRDTEISRKMSTAERDDRVGVEGRDWAPGLWVGGKDRVGGRSRDHEGRQSRPRALPVGGHTRQW